MYFFDGLECEQIVLHAIEVLRYVDVEGGEQGGAVLHYVLDVLSEPVEEVLIHVIVELEDHLVSEVVKALHEQRVCLCDRIPMDDDIEVPKSLL